MSTVKNAHDAEMSRTAPPAERRAAAGRAQLLKDADTLMVIVLENIEPDDQEAMEQNHPLLWSIRQELMESSNREVQRFNAVLGLWLVAQYPEYIQVATRKLCERLAEGLPLNWLTALETPHT